MTAVEVLGGIIAAQTVGMAVIVRAVLHMGNDVSRHAGRLDNHRDCIKELQDEHDAHTHPTAVGPSGVPL